MMDVASPRKFANRYTIHGELGAGGMASVHLGQLEGPGGFRKEVAIKRLHPHVAKDSLVAATLLEEARLAARVHHTNVVATLEVIDDEGSGTIVMEYVHGETLARLVRAASAHGGIPLGIASGILVGVLRGLHAAHEASSDGGEPLGIVHRDVSPQNIIVGADGVARLLDFGIAKAIGGLQTTEEGQIKGKVAYMAPEQLRGEPLDRRTDVFAASTVLWELLTGERLFKGASPAESMAKVLLGEVPAPSTLVSSLPLGLDDVVLRGLAFEARERFPTARAMADALEGEVPPASAGRIGEWLEGLVGDTLRTRHEELRRLRPPAAVEAVSGEGSVYVVETRLEATPSVTRASRRTVWLAALALPLGALVFAVASRPSPAGPVAAPMRSVPPDPSVPSSSSALASVARPSPPSEASAAPTAEPSPRAEPVEAPRTTREPVRAASTKPPAPRPPPTSAATTPDRATTPIAAAAPNCHYEKVVHDGGIIVPSRVCP